MKGLTIKFSEVTLRRLEKKARATGRSLAAIRERVEVGDGQDSGTVYALTDDLAVIVKGGRRAATNNRRRFHR